MNKLSTRPPDHILRWWNLALETIMRCESFLFSILWLKINGSGLSKSLPPADLWGMACKVTSALALLFRAEATSRPSLIWSRLVKQISSTEQVLRKLDRNVAAPVSAQSYILVSYSRKRKNNGDIMTFYWLLFNNHHSLRKTCDHQTNKKVF